jgi:hypothetical protein
LWWLDTDCVDCLRVGNRVISDWQRRRVEKLLKKLSVRPEMIPDHRVAEVLEYLERPEGNGSD